MAKSKPRRDARKTPITRYCIVCSKKVVTAYDRQYFCGEKNDRSCWEQLVKTESAQDSRYHKALVRQDFKCFGCEQPKRLRTMILHPRKLDSLGDMGVVAVCLGCRTMYYKEMAAKP